MLHLILGISGTCKTAFLHEQIQTCVEGGRKAILLVPEQYSFESEKALYRRLGAQGALSVEVLSFTRLCDRIFREYGGMAGAKLDDTAKYLLMSVTLGELGGALPVYQKSCGNAAFAAAMCDTVSELKTAGATPETLREAAQNAGDDTLMKKMEDIALIYEGYQAMLERGYIDPDDGPRRALKRLSGQNFFKEYTVFIDGFMAFMGSEWKLLARILEDSPAVYAALTCAGLDAGDKTGVFAAPSATAARLIRIAREVGTAIAPPVTMRELHRFSVPVLSYLAEEYPAVAPVPFEGEANGIALAACEDVYDELESAAAEICALVREQGYRYREIALIGRDLEDYLVPLQTVFGRYHIPFFTDLRADIQVHPFASGLLSALDAAKNGYQTETMLQLAKNCITGIDPIEAGELENYCYLWGTTGSAWIQPFTNHPDGMAETFTPEQQARLDRLNDSRTRLVKPLIQLRKALKDCDGRGFAAAAFGWLERSGAAEHLQQSAEEMTEIEAKSFLETAMQVWDILIGLLDVFGGALANVRLPLTRLCDLLRMGISAADIGVLPQTLDQVIVGTADRIRPDSPRAVFVLGLCEGKFPRWDTPGGVFSATERELLKAQGVDLLRTAGQHALFEKYYLYYALTQASEHLRLSWPLRDTAGTGISPSPAVARISALCGVKAQSPQGGLWRVAGERTAFDELARSWREETPEHAALKGYFARRAPERLAILETAGAVREFRMEDPAAAKGLFGEQIRISPSRAERYYQCPFSCFCQSGLRLRPRRRVEFNPLESGSLIHLVLEKMVKKYGGRGLASLEEETISREVSEIIETELSTRIVNFEEMPARFKYLFRRLVGTLTRLLQRLALEFSQSEFIPAAFELPIGLDAGIKPLNLCAPDGTRVIVEGIVDRVDLLERDGKRYVRVVDYKSGGKVFRLSDVCYGLNLQMLIYLFSICENEPAGGAVPAGVLYMPARDGIISAQRNAPAETVREEHLKKLRMNGLLLDNREILSAMEPELAGVFIPVKTKKDGSIDKDAPLATLAQMGKIRRQVEQLLLGMAHGLSEGKIAAAPADGLTDTHPCEWCEYHTICAHEEDDPVRKLADLDREAALKMMGEGGE